MQTVLLNHSSNSLWEIEVEDGEDFSDWEIRTSASYRPDMDTSSWDARMEIDPTKRRSQSQGQRSSQTNASSPAVDQNPSTHWYPFWKEYNDEQSHSQPPVFSASTTYENMTLWDGTPEYAGLHQPEAQINISMSNTLRKVRLVTPGPLIFRRLLGSALLVDADDPEKQFTIFRELVQPYNFSRSVSEVTFLTPTQDKVAVALDMDGYATIVLHMPTGTVATVQRLLFYTED